MTFEQLIVASVTGLLVVVGYPFMLYRVTRRWPPKRRQVARTIGMLVLIIGLFVWLRWSFNIVDNWYEMTGQ